MNVASFYRFIDVHDPQALAAELRARCASRGLLGTVLVAAEGINGTLAGSTSDIDAVLDWLTAHLELDAPLDVRATESSEAPFRRMRVKVKREIVTLGRPDIRAQDHTGEHVPPEKWNDLLDDPDVLLIDTRNHYEVEVGRFPGAVEPATDSFRELPQFLERLADLPKDYPVAMYCTGGIRCEKASALLLDMGFERVYQLEGGVLNYLATMPNADNRWRGECFVFDQRVAIDRDLAEGQYVQCHACRRPLSSADIESPDYREGVSCPHCVGAIDSNRRARLEERRRQVRLSRERGEPHIGAVLKPEAKTDNGRR